MTVENAVSERRREGSEKEDEPAEKDDDGIAFGGDETEGKDVLRSTRVALGCSLSERRFGMQRDLLVLGANEVVNDVRTRGRAARVAEPLVADEALDDAGGVVDTAVAERAERVSGSEQKDDESEKEKTHLHA